MEMIIAKSNIGGGVVGPFAKSRFSNLFGTTEVNSFSIISDTLSRRLN